MEKTKVKVVKLKNNQTVVYNTKNNSNQLLVKLIINTFVLLLADALFKSMVIDGLIYAFLTASIISLLNHFIRPLIVAVTLPLTVFTFGIFYPFINVIILKIASFLMGSHFQIEGIIIPLIISFFISFMNYSLEKIIIGDKKWIRF